MVFYFYFSATTELDTIDESFVEEVSVAKCEEIYFENENHIYTDENGPPTIVVMPLEDDQPDDYLLSSGSSGLRKSKRVQKKTPKALDFCQPNYYNWHNISKTVSDMRKRSILCDVVLAGYDYEETRISIRAHSVVLAASSKVLYQQFVHNNFKPGTYMYRMDSMHSNTLQIVVDFMYGTVPTRMVQTKLLREGGKLLKVSSIQQYCERFSKKHVRCGETKLLSKTSAKRKSTPAKRKSTPAKRKSTPDKRMTTPTKATKSTLKSTISEKANVKKRKVKKEIPLCVKCNKYFFSKKKLNEHLMETHDMYQCQFCLLLFWKENVLLNHTAICKHKKTGQKKRFMKLDMYKCFVCSEYFSLKKDLNAHLNNEHNIHIDESSAVLKCDHCPKMFWRPEVLNLHMEVCSEKCKRGTSNVDSHSPLNETSANCITGNVFPCDICSNIYISDQALRAHKLKDHVLPTTDTGDMLDAKKHTISLEDDTEKEINEMVPLAVSNVAATIESDDPLKKTYACNTEIIKGDLVETSINCTVDLKKLEVFKCGVCPDMIYISSASLFAHMAKVHGGSFNVVNNKVKSRTPTREVRKNKTRQFIKGSLTCSICKQKYVSRHDLGNHVQTCHKEQGFSCELCDMVYETKKSLQRHSQRKHGVKCGSYYSDQQQYCYICNEKFSECYNALRHMVERHRGHMFYMCSICGKLLARRNTVDSMVIHMKNVHRLDATFVELRELRVIITPSSLKAMTSLINSIENSCTRGEADEWGKTWLHTYFPCFHCNETFRSMMRLVEHIKEHLAENSDKQFIQNPKIYPCPSCDLGYEYEDEYQQHILSHHKDILQCFLCYKQVTDFKHYSNHCRRHTFLCREVQHKCTYCEEVFENKNDLGKHNLSVHNAGFTCEYCGNTYHNATILAVHTQIHTLPSKFSCTFCPKTFQRRSQLNEHLRTHTKERNFSCEVCGVSFKLMKTLRKHFNELHNPNYVPDHICNICGKGFAIKSKLTNHQFLQHTNIRPFKCRECGSTFKARGNLTKHLRRVHGRHVPVPIGRQKYVLRLGDAEQTLPLPPTDVVDVEIQESIMGEESDEDIHAVMHQLEL